MERTTTPSTRSLIRVVSSLFVLAVGLYVWATWAEANGSIDGFTEDLLDSIVVLLVYAPGLYAAKGALRDRTIRIAFSVAVVFMVFFRFLDIVDEIPSAEFLWLFGTRSLQFSIVKQLAEAAAILSPLAAFYLVIQNLGNAHSRLSREIERRSQEIAERRRTERALMESEQKFRTLAQTTSAAIFIFKDARCVYSNLAAQSILGYSIDELSVTPFFAQLASATSEDGSREAQRAQRFEIRATTRSGETRWLDMTLGPAHIDGERVVLGTAFDITERKDAEGALAANEEWYRTLLKHSSDIFCVLNHGGAIRYIAASQADVIGPEPERELVGQNVLQYVHPDERESVSEFLCRAAEKPGITGPLETRVVDREGTYRTIEIVCNNLLASTCIQGLVINARDISERKQLEEQLRQSQKMDALGRLAGGVAHDFNNVLTSIFVYTEILHDRLQEHPGVLPKVQEIRKAAERATRLTRQLLAFSRHQVEQARPMDLNTTISEMSKMLECLIGENIALATDLETTLGRVLADPAHLEQVLLNVILNARDAMPDGGSISIATRNIDLGDEGRDDPAGLRGPYVMLSITDTGSGMDQVTKARLFEPFFTTKQEGRGTGLGLATVYGILQQYGARIAVNSTIGRGTTFTIYFPQTPVLEQPESSQPEPVREQEGTETVLVVEDDEEIRALAGRILERRGYTSIEAATPEDALAITLQADLHIDLIVTDVVMPQMSGPTLVKRIRENRPEVRVLYVSGYTNDAFLRGDDSAPPSGFLPKPFNAHLLATKVREMLDAPVREGSWLETSEPSRETAVLGGR